MASAAYDAMTIATWFVMWAAADAADLSNLKLQKLLYYAQGHHLAQHGRPLFSDAIQAWSHGPVVPAVYHAFKQYGSGDIPAPSDFEWDSVDPKTTQLLIRVWDTFGGYGAWRLRNLTHAEAPWADHFVTDARHVEIPQADMARFFRTKPSV